MSEQHDESHRALLDAARSGDRAAFGQLVRYHKSSLYRFVRRYVGNPEDAYDLLQETFVSAWLALARFEPERSLATWLHTIALNKCRDHGRRRAVRRRLSLLFFTSERALSQAQPDDWTESGDRQLSLRRHRLDAAIAALPGKYKEPLLLTLVSGMTHRQAARQLGLTTKAVQMRIQRAKQKLSEALAEPEIISAPPEPPETPAPAG